MKNREKLDEKVIDKVEKAVEAKSCLIELHEDQVYFAAHDSGYPAGIKMLKGIQCVTAEVLAIMQDQKLIFRVIE